MDQLISATLPRAAQGSDTSKDYAAGVSCYAHGDGIAK